MLAFVNILIASFGRSRSRSRSRSPSCAKRYDRGVHSDNGYRSKSKTSKIEYITEFGGSTDMDDRRLEGVSPPSSPLQADLSNRSGHSIFFYLKR